VAGIRNVTVFWDVIPCGLVGGN